MTSQQVVGKPPLPDPTSMLKALSDNGGTEVPPEVLALIQAQREAEQKVAWASFVENQYTACKNARAPFERQWYLNLAFIAGRQYVSPIEIPGHGFRLTSAKVPPWRVRIVINKIRTAVRTECAKLTASKPIPTVVPSTNEDEDFSAAVVAETILKAKFANAQFMETYRSWVWWGVATGSSYLKTYWDASAKDYESMTLPKPPTMPDGSAIPDEIIDKVQGMRQHLDTPIPAVGKICFERINPFHLYVPDLLAERLEDQPYIIQVMTRSPDWVERTFGFKPTPDSRASNTIMDSATVIAKGSEEHLDACIVKEMWIKPGSHPDFPEGGVLTVINSRVVQNVMKWPCPFPEFPFYKYRGIPTGGFYDDSVVVDLIPIQKEYNRTKSQMIEIKNTVGKPKLVYQQGSINPRKISSEPGASVAYQAGYQPPIVMPGAEVPQSMGVELDRLTADFDDISGQHEITRGSSPSGVTSGTAIAFLEEQDNTKLAYQVAGIETATEMFGRHYLQYVTQYWDDDRVVKVTGKNNMYEAIHWKKGALRGNTDVRVQSGSALPYSKAAKQAFITEMMQNGFIEPQVGLEILDMGGFEKAMEEFLVDKRQAMRENLKLADAPEKIIKILMSPAPGPNGESPMEVLNQADPAGKPLQMNGDGTPFQAQPPVPVNSWDNHEAHVQWHNQFRKSQEFEALPEANKQAFELHVQLHQMALTANMVNTSGQVTQQNQPTAEEKQLEAEMKFGPSQGAPPGQGSQEPPVEQ